MISGRGSFLLRRLCKRSSISTRSTSVSYSPPGLAKWGDKLGAIHAEVNPSQLLNAFVHSFGQALRISDIDGSNSNDPRAVTGAHQRLGHRLRLLDISTDDAGIRTEVDHSPDLGTAYRPIASGAEDYFLVWANQSSPVPANTGEDSDLLKIPSLQTSLR